MKKDNVFNKMYKNIKKQPDVRFYADGAENLMNHSEHGGDNHRRTEKRATNGLGRYEAQAIAESYKVM